MNKKFNLDVNKKFNLDVNENEVLPPTPEKVSFQNLSFSEAMKIFCF